MLRSMLIGLAIAALLQVGVFVLAPAGERSFAAGRIDWVQVQAAAVDRLFEGGLIQLVR